MTIRDALTLYRAGKRIEMRHRSSGGWTPIPQHWPSWFVARLMNMLIWRFVQ